MKLTILLAIATAVTAVTCETTALDQFVKSNLQFTANLYREVLKEHGKNFVFSPFSAQVILALTRAGAKGQTADEFTSSLSLPDEKVTEEALSAFLPLLKRSDDNLKLHTANKVYVSQDVSIDNGFKQIATGSFGADIQNVDFTKSEEARRTINGWVEQQTNNKIRDIIESGILNDWTKLVLVNALYFNGKWVTPFDPFTFEDDFRPSATETKKVQMMSVEDRFRYYEDEQLDAKFLELPYKGDGVAMVIALPNKIDGLAGLEARLDDVLKPKPFEQQLVNVKVPQFSVESSVPLKKPLETLGLKTAFTSEADFGRISAVPLVVTDVFQKAFINVTTGGTEASAATFVHIEVTSAQIPSGFSFVANRPFFYYLKSNDVIIFAGRFVAN